MESTTPTISFMFLPLFAHRIYVDQISNAKTKIELYLYFGHLTKQYFFFLKNQSSFYHIFIY